MTAFVHGSNARLYWAGFDISRAFGQVSAERSRDVADSTAFGDTAHRFTVGLVDGKLDAQGMYDASSPSVPPDSDSVLRAAFAAVEPPICYCPEGAAIGNEVEMLAGVETDYAIQAVVSDVVKVTASAQGAHGLERGHSLHDMVSEAAGTVNSTSFDNGASSANGLAAVLQASSITAGTLAVKVQHSTDNSTWVDLITFTTVLAASAPAAQRLTVTGTVNRYLRAQAVVTTGPATYHVAAGRLPRNG